MKLKLCDCVTAMPLTSFVGRLACFIVSDLCEGVVGRSGQAQCKCSSVAQHMKLIGLKQVAQPCPSSLNAPSLKHCAHLDLKSWIPGENRQQVALHISLNPPQQEHIQVILLAS